MSKMKEMYAEFVARGALHIHKETEKVAKVMKTLDTTELASASGFVTGIDFAIYTVRTMSKNTGMSEAECLQVMLDAVRCYRDAEVEAGTATIIKSEDAFSKDSKGTVH